VSRPSDSFAKSLQLFEDGVGRGRPHEGVAAAVLFPDKGIDLLDEVSHASERPAAHGSLCDDVGPDLDLVEPGSVSPGLVHVHRAQAPHLGVRVADPGCIRHDAELTLERQREADADREAVDGSDQRLL